MHSAHKTYRKHNRSMTFGESLVGSTLLVCLILSFSNFNCTRIEQVEITKLYWQTETTLTQYDWVAGEGESLPSGQAEVISSEDNSGLRYGCELEVDIDLSFETVCKFRMESWTDYKYKVRTPSVLGHKIIRGKQSTEPYWHEFDVVENEDLVVSKSQPAYYAKVTDAEGVTDTVKLSLHDFERYENGMTFQAIFRSGQLAELRPLEEMP